MPDMFLLETDGTCREGRNQHMEKFENWLVTAKKFQLVNHGSGRKGHTHGKADKMFSTAQTILSNAPLLEYPPDFKDLARHPSAHDQNHSIQ